MVDVNTAIRNTYEQDGHFLETVRHFLDSLPPGPPSPQQLGGIDQFHAKGLAATAELAAFAAVPRGAVVLDAGSGLGGPSRYLAKTLECEVLGVDLTPGFVAAARLIADRVGAGERVRYQVGDVLALPVDDAAFDVVWTQHVVMNVADRDRAYAEFRRVLRTGGMLAFHDVLAAEGGEPVVYPVPWAETPSSSFLLTEAQTRAALERTGFRCGKWQDATQDTLAWFAQLQSAPPDPVAPGPQTILGPGFREKVGNFARNLREGRTRIVMSVWNAV